MRGYLAAGLVAALAFFGCDSLRSPTAPPQAVRTYVGQFTIGPSHGRTVTVNYDQTWVDRRDALERQVRAGVDVGGNLIDRQLGHRDAPSRPLQMVLFAEGDLREQGVPFSTKTEGGSAGQGVAVCSEYGRTLEHCVAHNLQHAMGEVLGTREWPNALHLETRSQWLLPTAYTILGNLTSEPSITSFAVHPDACDTDQK